MDPSKKNKPLQLYHKILLVLFSPIWLPIVIIFLVIGWCIQLIIDYFAGIIAVILPILLLVVVPQPISLAILFAFVCFIIVFAIVVDDI